jgi:signal transduction histidine kinase
MGNEDTLRAQLESLHAISVEIAALRDMGEIHDRALGYCLELTESKYAFTGLLVDGPDRMDVAAVKGFEPFSPEFYAKFHLMAVRSSVVGVVIAEGRSYISNDVEDDSRSVGLPYGHPPVERFLGVPLRVGSDLIGMIGVANKAGGYAADDARLLQTFANQVAVAIDNARLYERQREMIVRFQQLHERLRESERQQLLLRDRERIAERLHDEIGQDIFTLGLGLSSLVDEVPDPALAARLQQLRQLAIQTAEQVRNVIFALAGPGHIRGDLITSIRTLLLDIRASEGIQTELVVTGSPVEAPPNVNGVVYAATKEALTNVGRHASASMVVVSLRYEDNWLHVVVQDDGDGMPEQELRNYQRSYLHFGLRHMREQILELGGSLEAANGEEVGATVRFAVPVPMPG